MVLDHPIKTLGLQKVRVMLHPEVMIQVGVNVARSPEEAEKQARGERVTTVEEEEAEPDLEQMLDAEAAAAAAEAQRAG